MRTTESKMTVKEIYENRDRFDFNPGFQRNGGIWSNDKKVLLIETAVLNFPLQQLVVGSRDGKLIVIDGKQRCEAIIGFRNNEYSLTNDITDVTKTDTEENIKTYELVGKKYNELPIVVQQKIDEFEIKFEVVEDATDQEYIEIFHRCNNGVTLSNFEHSRAMYYGETIKEVSKISEHAFFKEQAKITDSGRTRMVDQQVVTQTIMMVEAENTGFSNAEMDEYMRKSQDVGISDETKNKMYDTADYIAKVFRKRKVLMEKPLAVKAPIKIDEEKLAELGEEERNRYISVRQQYESYLSAKDKYYKEVNNAKSTKYLNRVSIPPIFLCATIAKDKMKSEEFYNWVNNFLEGKGKATDAYKNACLRGTAKKQNVNARKNAILHSLLKYLVKNKLMTSDESNVITDKYLINY